MRRIGHGKAQQRLVTNLIWTSLQLVQLSVGNGETARFWSDCWLNGQAPFHIAPLLHPLASRKNLMVKEALTGSRWMRGLHRLVNEAQLDQFLNLRTAIQSMHLTENRDMVIWNLTTEKKYSVCSA